MVDLFRALGRRSETVVEKTKTKKHVDLTLISAAVHQGCMGLPQELVDNIMDTLHDDISTLKACSLTCKSMFASTRRLIHQTLSLTDDNNRSVLTFKERWRYAWEDPDVRLRLLSRMGERGLLQYARRVHYDSRLPFIPSILLPHLHHFQSLDHVHTLILASYIPVGWENDYTTYFVHFYPTLTSLTLRIPRGSYSLLLQFALQFPKLENLCIEQPAGLGYGDPATPAIIDQSPHSRRHLRLAGDDTRILMGQEFDRGLPSKMSFRSVELDGFFGRRAQYTLNACACTLEGVTIIPRWSEHIELQTVSLTEIRGLRRLIVRMMFNTDVSPGLGMTVSTIASTTFCEFVLELGKIPHRFGRVFSGRRGYWRVIDRIFEGKFANHEDFRLIVRTGKLFDQETFQRRTRKAFPLLASRGCIHFEEDLLL